MDDQLSRALPPVLHDLRATGGPLPGVEDSDWQPAAGAESALLRSPDGSGMGVWVDTAASAADQVSMLSDQVQEWVIEELARLGRPTNWPRCPHHPDTHPMAATADGDRAVWTCPKSGAVVTEIGLLPEASPIVRES